MNSWETSMKPNPLIEEIHATRAAIAAKFNNNLEAICEDARRREALSGRKPVFYPPSRVVAKRRTKKAG